MDPKWITASVGVVGVLFGASGFGWGMYTWLKQAHRNRVNLHVQSLCDLYEKTETATLLKCHGIDADALQLADVEQDDFRYLLINFTVSRMYQHSRRKIQVGSFRRNSYRYNLCKSPTTRNAYPFLQQILGDVEIANRIEATFEDIDMQLASAKTSDSEQ